MKYSVLIILFLTIFLVISASASDLTEYYLTIDQEYLDALYADPYSHEEFPGIIQTQEGSSPCLVRFRGQTSLQFPKKSWAITVQDSSLTGRTRLNLCAEYVDPGMMRNCILLKVTELMGYPAPATEHVRFSVNGDYLGVFLDVERIDSAFLQRWDYTPVAIFKALSEASRFMPLPSNQSQLSTYRACADSEMHLSSFCNFINLLSADINPLPLVMDQVIAYYAVSLCFVDTDSGAKNFYVFLNSDGRWGIVPWDRGNSMGSNGTGIFQANHAYAASLLHFQRSNLFSSLIEDPRCMELLQEKNALCRQIMADQIPDFIDSVFNRISQDLYNDPSVPWSVREINQARDDLQWFCAARSTFISSNSLVPGKANVTRFHVEEPWLEPGSVSQVEITIDRTDYTTVMLRWREGSTYHFSYMTEEEYMGCSTWKTTFTMPDNFEVCQMEIYFRSSGDPRLTFFYPNHSLLMYSYLPSATPCFVTPEPLTEVPSDESRSLSVNSPVVYGDLLWTVPLVNTSEDALDLSCCGFRAGDSPHRIFLPPETVVESGDTIFLTNSVASFNSLFPEDSAFGDFPCPPPENGVLTLFDPCWTDIYSMDIPEAASYTPVESPLMISELCPAQSVSQFSEDWIELYNPSNFSMNVGGFYLEDNEGNRSMLPWNTIIEPKSFLIMAREPALMQGVFPEVSFSICDLGFGMNSEIENVSLYDRTGRKMHSVLCISGDQQEGYVTALIHPSLPLNAPGSWENLPLPGTPGAPNRMWNESIKPLFISINSGNPVLERTISYSVTAAEYPIEVQVFDLTGRTVSEPNILSEISRNCTVVIPEQCSSGMYFLVARSANAFASEKFTVLR